MEFALKYGTWELPRRELCLKLKITLQYILDIPVCFKQKMFFSYRVLTTYFRITGLKTCVPHRSNVNLPFGL